VRLLRPSEAMELLNCSKSWLYRAVAEERIPCVRLGGDDGPVRFDEDELIAYIDRSRRPVLR
jgi:excisionase family DNA binding protein